MQIICIAKLKPFSPRLHGATIGEEHARQVLEQVANYSVNDDSIILDFSGLEGASASYLKRLLNPFFAQRGDKNAFPRPIFPIVMNVESSDLKEELDDYLAGKGCALVLADRSPKRPKFRELLGCLDGAAAETFKELQALKKSTAAELYGRNSHRTTNQTAWNNRLRQLVEMRIARRTRIGRVWVYEPIVES